MLVDLRGRDRGGGDMNKLSGFAFVCILFVLLLVMWMAEIFHKLDGGRSWLEAIDDI